MEIQLTREKLNGRLKVQGWLPLCEKTVFDMIKVKTTTLPTGYGNIYLNL